MILAAWWNCGSARSRWVWGRNLNLRRDLTFATVGLLVVGGFGKNSQEESELLLLVVGGFGKNSQEEPELRGVSGFQVSRLLDILHLLSILLVGVSIGPRCSLSLGQLT